MSSCYEATRIIHADVGVWESAHMPRILKYSTGTRDLLQQVFCWSKRATENQAMPFHHLPSPGWRRWRWPSSPSNWRMMIWRSCVKPSFSWTRTAMAPWVSWSSSCCVLSSLMAFMQRKWMEMGGWEVNGWDPSIEWNKVFVHHIDLVEPPSYWLDLSTK